MASAELAQKYAAFMGSSLPRGPIDQCRWFETPRSDDFFARASEPTEVSNYRHITEHRYYASSLQQSNADTRGSIGAFPVELCGRNRHLSPMKAWKTVDTEHADLVARGSLLIGTLAGHVALENPALAGQAPPQWAFCMTEPGWRIKDAAAKPRAIFEVSDVPLLARFIMQHFAVQMLGAGHRPVRYDATPQGGPLDPFLKDQSFAAEREIRIVFDPRPGVAVDGPLLIKPDYSIAALFKRVE
jgi:hypothetical protein